MSTPEWGDVSREFPDLFPNYYVPGDRLRNGDGESDEEEAIIVLEEDTPRVGFTPGTSARETERSGRPGATSTPLYYYDEDQGFVDGDDTPTTAYSRVTSAATKRTSAKSTQAGPKKEPLDKVLDRRQKFHRGFNYIRARYPSQFHGADKATPRGKSAIFRQPSSFCPPSRYGREARVVSARDKDSKVKKWRDPPVYPPRQKVRDVAVDCHLLRMVETLDVSSQAVPKMVDAASQRPLAMVDAGVQYPRTRRRESGTQASLPKSESRGIQSVPSTTNALVETCYRLVYTANNFIVTEDVDTQTPGPNITVSLDTNRSDNSYAARQPNRTPDASDTPVPSESRLHYTPNNHGNNTSESMEAASSIDNQQLRLLVPSYPQASPSGSARSESVDYSSEWEDSDSDIDSEGPRAVDMDPISVSVRDDAHCD